MNVITPSSIKTIEFTLEGLPLTPNQLCRMHWAQVAKEKKNWRVRTAYEAKKHAPKNPLLAITLYLIRCSSRPCDVDNIVSACKPIIDGLRDAGIIADDGPDILRNIVPRWEKVKHGQGHMKIVVVECAD